MTVSIDLLKYQRTSQETPAVAAASDEWLTVKARYQRPEGGVSTLLTDVLRPGGNATWLPLASSIAEFALLLREHSNDAARWTGLERRISQFRRAPSLASGVRELAELVATSRGLAQARRWTGGRRQAADPLRPSVRAQAGGPAADFRIVRGTAARFVGHRAAYLVMTLTVVAAGRPGRSRSKSWT